MVKEQDAFFFTRRSNTPALQRLNAPRVLRHALTAKYALRIRALVLRSTGSNPAADNVERIASGETHSAIVAQ